MGWLEALVLGIVQGLTEFLPISSSAHQAIVGQFFGGTDPGSAFTAITQLGTESAVIIYFRKDIWLIIKNWLFALIGKLPRDDPEARLGWLVIIGSIPIVVLGLLFQDAIDHGLRNLWTVAAMLAGFGIIIGVIDQVAANSRPLESMTWRNGVFLGLVQSLALIPGVSRSGATIAGGLALGYQRVAAAKYSFLLAIPAVVGSGLFKLADISADPVPPADCAGHRDRFCHRLRGDRLVAALCKHPHLYAVRDLPHCTGGVSGDPAAHRCAESLTTQQYRSSRMINYVPTPERSSASAATVSALSFSSTELP
jgi:undecaprenyl-diphosphatase